VPVYRYQSVSINQTQLSAQVPGAPVIEANGPAIYVDVTAPSGSKADLDEYMTSVSYEYVSTDPTTTPDQAASVATVPRSILLTSIAGRNNYRVSVGDWILDAAGTTTLEIDSGAGFVPQAYGADYSLLRRVTPPATVADAAIGFSLAGGPVPAGWTMRFGWTNRTILVEPSSIAKILVPENYAVSWQANGANAPNGVLVPELPGTQVEFWRQTARDGGRRGNLGVLKREGRRYLPFYRGAVDVFRFAVSDFAPTQRYGSRGHYRVCYYDPSNGARSLLSRDVIVVCNLAQADRVNGRTQRRIGSVWIE